MSLAEIRGTPKGNAFKTNKNVSPIYKAKVEEVRYAKKGTLITRAGKVEARLGIPAAAKDPLSLARSGFNLLFGNRQAQTKALMGLAPIDIKTTQPYDFSKIDPKSFAQGGTTTETIKDALDKAIDKKKEEDPNAKKYWEGGVGVLFPDVTMPNITFPDIKLPDIFGGLKEIGKYVLIGGVALVAILILTRRE